MGWTNWAGSSCRPMRVSAALLICTAACACATVGQAAQVTLNEDGVLLIDGVTVA